MAITDTVDALLSKFGTTMTLTRVTKGVYDPQSLSVTNTTATVTFNGVFTNYTEETKRNSQIDEGDRNLLMRTNDAPKVGDTITAGANTLKVKAVEQVAPADSAIIYKVRVGV